MVRYTVNAEKMNDATLGFLEKCDKDDFVRILKEFNVKNNQTMVFEELSAGDVRKRLWHTLFERMTGCELLCLEAIRILSRDKRGLDEIFTVEMGKTLAFLAGLAPVIDIKSGQTDIKVIIEAQKCLCNLIYNSLTAQRLCCVNGCVEGIAERLKTFKDQQLNDEIKYFDMKMLFLLTALCTDVRSRFKTELHGMTYLIELLALLSKNFQQQRLSVGEVDVKRHLMDDHNVDLICEVLKILFNLTVDVDKGNIDEDDEVQFSRLVSIIRELLLCLTVTPAKREELQSHTVNLLTNLPLENCESLVRPLLDLCEDTDSMAEFDYEGHNMEAVDCLLAFLESKLQKPGKSLREAISPIVYCLIECCRGNRIFRKYLRYKILPPLRDVYNRPEVGETSRNKLCRLLTHPVVEVKDLVAELLFVLCKENVGRLIKYSGYGNAAGLLAARGLVPRSKSSGKYSSESEDSETEEYRAVKDCINPVIGCYDEPKPDLMAGMTEEQKEYEVMQLVNMMNKITETGVVTPMRVDEDGKLKPIEHVLELREGAGPFAKNKTMINDDQEDDD